MHLISFTALGFLMGMGHALEADHLAAVATMMDDGGKRRALIARGAYWGLGHTIALFVICSVVVMLGMTISGTFENSLELAVGVMIVGLGLNVLWRMRRDRLHVHVHQHDGHQHLHVHSHAGDTVKHEQSPHRHEHHVAPTVAVMAPPQAATRTRSARLKPLLIGLVHGAAGSAGLLVLIVATTQSPAHAMLYFAIFGLGTMMGMASLSAVASLPLGMLYRSGGVLRTALSIGIAAVALYVGTTHAMAALHGLMAAS